MDKFDIQEIRVVIRCPECKRNFWVFYEAEAIGTPTESISTQKSCYFCGKTVQVRVFAEVVNEQQRKPTKSEILLRCNQAQEQSAKWNPAST